MISPCAEMEKWPWSPDKIWYVRMLNASPSVHVIDKICNNQQGNINCRMIKTTETKICLPWKFRLYLKIKIKTSNKNNAIKLFFERLSTVCSGHLTFAWGIHKQWGLLENMVFFNEVAIWQQHSLQMCFDYTQYFPKISIN